MFDFIKKKVQELTQKIIPKKESAEGEEKQKKDKKASTKTKVKLGIIKGAIAKVKEVELKESELEPALEEFELSLIQGDVAYEVAEKIKENIKNALLGIKVKEEEIEPIVKKTMADTVRSVVKKPFDLVEKVRSKKPFVIVVFGTNGSGKTTTIAKLAHMFIKQGMCVVVSASDTFRAASMEQLEVHAKNIGFKLIKRSYGSDPTSVAFDAVKHAESKRCDVVIVDTAGRQELNINLMNELKKIVRVIKPDLKLFVGESIAGNALYDQVKMYDDLVGIDGIILTKFDLDPKGGSVISASYATGVPVIYLCTGQGYDDIILFDPNFVVKRLVE